MCVNLAAGEHHGLEFLKINPAGKVPVLVDDDLVLTESVAIVLYLTEKYPHQGFLPTDLKLRSQVYRWLLFTATELEQPLWRIAVL
jgi:glutathione S-transferase